MDASIAIKPVFNHYLSVVITSAVSTCIETFSFLQHYSLSLSLPPSLPPSPTFPFKTLSPLDMYPRLLCFQPVLLSSYGMSLARPRICPVVSNDSISVASVL